MKGEKIALAVICKASDEEAKILYRLLAHENLYKQVDKVFVTITGKNEACEKVAKEAGAEVSRFEWVNDFSAARNYNWSQVPKEYDWITWADCDDVIAGAGSIRNLIDGAGEEISGLYATYAYEFDEHGECVVKHDKLRFARNDGTYEWVGRLHEDLMPRREVTTMFAKGVEWRQFKTDEAVEESARRNLEICEQAMEDGDDDPRALWNLANAYVMVDRNDEAIDAFFDFIKGSGSEEEKFLSWHRVSYAYYRKGDLANSIEAAMECVRMRPWYPDGYLMLGTAFFSQEKYRHAKEVLLDGLRKPIPDHETLVRNPRDYDFNPMMLLAKCYFQLGQPTEAADILEKLHGMFPKNKEVKDKMDMMREVERELAMVDGYCEEVAKAGKRSEIRKIFDGIPEKLRQHPKLCHLHNVHFVKEKSGGRDVSFFCYQTSENWSPDSLETGIGGSEEAVIHLASQFEEKGWNPTVYNSIGTREKRFGRQSWKPFWAFNPRDREDAVIAWRTPMAFEHDVNAPCRLVDLHDVLPEPEFTTKRLSRISKICVKSNYHRSLYPNVPDEKFEVIGHGVDSSQFGKGRRDPLKLIYTSSYDRGLEHLLDMWPEVRKAVPKAELHVFYGWQTFDSMYENDGKMQAWKKSMVRKMDQEGILEHGRVSHGRIAEEMSTAGIFAYPCHFEEIFCISAAKAQVAGAIPVVTDYASLSEVVRYGDKVRGDVKGTEIWDVYRDTLIGTLRKSGKIDRKPMMEWASREFDWSKVADRWIELFEEYAQK